MADTWCVAQRRAVVLVWVPVLAGIPLFNLHGGAIQVAAQVVLVLLLIGAAAAVVFAERRIALLAVAAGAVAAASQGPGWLTPWGLLAITAPVILCGWALFGTIAVAAAGTAVSAWLLGDVGVALWASVVGVLLSGLGTTSFLRLIETNEELRRTRAELARAAVVEERERFSRDLHDLLGHTMSVMVVKAQAVRRLAGRDPEAVAEHAADIERIGRDGLLDVRRAVDAMRSPSLAEELDGARRALDAAGIDASVPTLDRRLPEEIDQMLAWVVRESATNVIRHSGAAHASFDLRDGDGHLQLVVTDDGVGGPPPTSDREGGLDGLRRRVVAQGGRLEVQPGNEGFRLTARVPVP